MMLSLKFLDKMVSALWSTEFTIELILKIWLITKDGKVCLEDKNNTRLLIEKVVLVWAIQLIYFPRFISNDE